MKPGNTACNQWKSVLEESNQSLIQSENDIIWVNLHGYSSEDIFKLYTSVRSTFIKNKARSPKKAENTLFNMTWCLALVSEIYRNIEKKSEQKDDEITEIIRTLLRKEWYLTEAETTEKEFLSPATIAKTQDAVAIVVPHRHRQKPEDAYDYRTRQLPPGDRD